MHFRSYPWDKLPNENLAVCSELSELTYRLALRQTMDILNNYRTKQQHTVHFFTPSYFVMSAITDAVTYVVK